MLVKEQKKKKKKKKKTSVFDVKLYKPIILLLLF